MQVNIKHKAAISELIGKNPEFACFANLRVCENEDIRWNMHGKSAYCVQVMFIGKTGYGKSTTLNKICGGEYFDVNDVESCTKCLYSCEYKLPHLGEHYLSMCDLPGIGESISADKQYIRWYGVMLKKSACVVYVLRADQRDFSNDQTFFETLLTQNGKLTEKLIVGINYADKVEPISRKSPFVPSNQQAENLERKAEAVQKAFGVKRKDVVCYSASDGYNTQVLKNKIATSVELSKFY